MIKEYIRRFQAKENIKIKNYKPDKTLYILLLVGSIAFIAASFLFSTNCAWFTIIAGLGCSGIASVIVAWLVERANCKQKEKINEELLDHLFDRFDLEVKLEMENILSSCARKKEDIDVERDYSLAEISNLVMNTDDDRIGWDVSYQRLGKAFSSIDATILAFDPSEQHVNLFSVITKAQMNHISGLSIESRIGRDKMKSLVGALLGSDIGFIEMIYGLRNKEMKYKIPDNSKRLVEAFRKAKQ